MIYRITGSIYYAKGKVIRKMLSGVFNGLTLKSRVSGIDLDAVDAGTAPDTDVTENATKEYYVDVSFSGNQSEFLTMRDTLKSAVLSNDVLFDLTFIQEDDEHVLIEEERFAHADLVKGHVPQKN